MVEKFLKIDNLTRLEIAKCHLLVDHEAFSLLTNLQQVILDSDKLNEVKEKENENFGKQFFLFAHSNLDSCFYCSINKFTTYLLPK